MNVVIGLTPHSIFWVCIVSSIFIVLLVLISQNTKLISGIPMHLTVAVFAIVATRLIVPVEFLKINKTYVLYDIAPTIYEILTHKIGTLKGYDINILNILYFIWFTVSAILLVIYIIENIKLCRNIKLTPYATTKEQNVLKKLKEKFDCRFNVKLIVSEAVSSPSEYGYFTHTIFLNKANYTDEELEFILTHELFHYKYGTQWLKLLSELIWILFWWNPIIYIYKELLAARIEIYVDSKVTKKMTSHQIKSYLKTIFKAYYECDNKNVIILPLVGSFANQNEKNLKQRFELLSKSNKVNIPMCLYIMLITSVYLFISCRYIIQPGWQPEESELQDNSFADFEGENSYILFENGQYTLYFNGEPFAEVKEEDIEKFSNVPVYNK